MEIEIKPKSATRKRGLAYGRSVKHKEGQPAIIMVNGIGERNDETKAGIEAHMRHTGYDNLKAACDALGINVVWTNSNADDTTDEIDYAIQMAKTDLKADPKRIRLMGLSWGARRIKIWQSRGGVGESCFIRIASGFVGYVDEVPKLLEKPRPGWLFHSEKDPVVSVAATRPTFEKLKAANPTYPIYYTQYAPDLNPKDDHNIMGRITAAKPPVSVTIPAVLTPVGFRYPWTVTPKMSIYQWMEAVEKTGAGVDPENPQVQPPTQPEVPEAPKPTPKNGAIRKYVDIGKPTAVVITWDDGTQQTIKAGVGDSINNVGMSDTSNLVTIFFEKAKPLTIGPKRKIP